MDDKYLKPTNTSCKILSYNTDYSWFYYICRNKLFLSIKKYINRDVSINNQLVPTIISTFGYQMKSIVILFSILLVIFHDTYDTMITITMASPKFYISRYSHLTIYNNTRAINRQSLDRSVLAYLLIEI